MQKLQDQRQAVGQVTRMNWQTMSGDWPGNCRPDEGSKNRCVWVWQSGDWRADHDYICVLY